MMPVNDGAISPGEGECFDYKILLHHKPCYTIGFWLFHSLKARKHKQARVAGGEVNLK
jgi:hypothetical protein